MDDTPTSILASAGASEIDREGETGRDWRAAFDQRDRKERLRSEWQRLQYHAPGTVTDLEPPAAPRPLDASA